MSDFTLPNPVATSSPWLPAKIIDVVSQIKSDANGWRPLTTGTNCAWGTNLNFNLANPLVSQVTIGAGFASVGDDVFVGVVCRSGANAGGFIGCFVQSTGTSLCTVSTAGVRTTISTTVAYTRASGDVIQTSITGLGTGTATIAVTINGGTITYNLNTTTLFNGDATLAPGCWQFPQNTNALYLTNFQATGITGANNPVFCFGQTGAGYTTTSTGPDMSFSGGAIAFSAGYTAAFSGSVSMMYLFTPSGTQSATQFNIYIYNGTSVSAGSLVASSSLGTRQGNTLIGVPITASVISGNQYTLILSGVGGALLTQFDSTTPATGVDSQWNAATLPNGSPPSNTPSPTTGNGHEFTIWGEGLSGVGVQVPHMDFSFQPRVAS